MTDAAPSQATPNRPLHHGGHGPAAQAQIDSFHSDVVRKVAEAVDRDALVVVGMAMNPFVGKAKKALQNANLTFTVLDFGGYTGMWKQRLAIKMWSGWPTFPQVYVHGRLVGGFKETEAALASGDLQRWLGAGRS
ncbi:MAG: hypothetical protein RL071_5146 [Pseudomonadota bacterium]|jgi:glutaredoxin-related protein